MKSQNLIIFFGIAFFAIQSLIFTTLYNLNMPYTVDWWGVNYLLDYVTIGVFPFEELLRPINDHVIIFPRLLVLPYLLLSSFDFGNLLYIQWGIMSLSLFTTYLIIRRSESRLYWVLIPISAFIFSPLANSNYWAFIMLIWFLPSLGIFSVIWLLTKTTINLKILVAAISIAIMATFSSIIGVLAWLPGLVSLIHFNYVEKKWTDKKWLIIWILSLIITGLVYYSSAPLSKLQVEPFSIFSIEGYSFIATFVAVPFKLKYDFLMISVGTISIILSGFCVYYFTIFKKKIKIALPWMLFLLTGIVGAIMTRMGRVSDYHTGNLPNYIPIGELFQIGLLVMISLIILDIKKNYKGKYKKIILVFFWAVIITQMILLIPSYYNGWWRGDYYFKEKSDLLDCYSLYHGQNCSEIFSRILDDDGSSALMTFGMLNYWLENNLSFFGENNFNQQHIDGLKKFEEIWIDKRNILLGVGEIETINNIDVTNSIKFNLDTPTIVITGWILDHNEQPLDIIYLMVDEKPLLQYDDFQPISELTNNLEINNDLKPNWEISFLSGYFPEGCHDITIAGLSNGKKIILDQEIQLCKIS